MARPLRIERPNALYHVTARGNERQDIVRDNGDRSRFVQLLSQTVKEQGLLLHAWVLMDNHYHLLVETPNANLARSLRQINGIYTQWFNRKHRRVGHLFQGRYKSIMVGKETHLKSLCRYVVLNPVRAKMVKNPREYAWSNYRATAGFEPAPDWLEVDWIMGQFHKQRKQAQEAYRKYVMQGLAVKEHPWEQLEGQIYLGGREFLDSLRKRIKKEDDEIPMKQRRVRKSDVGEVLERVIRVYGLKGQEELTRRRRDGEARRVAIYWLRVEGGLGLKEIGRLFGLTYSTVSHQIGWVRRGMVKDKPLAQRILKCNPKT